MGGLCRPCGAGVEVGKKIQVLYIFPLTRRVNLLYSINSVQHEAPEKPFNPPPLILSQEEPDEMDV
jgi:hypothetical protein